MGARAATCRVAGAPRDLRDVSRSADTSSRGFPYKYRLLRGSFSRRFLHVIRASRSLTEDDFQQVGVVELNDHPRPIGSAEMSDTDSQDASRDYEGEFPVASPSGSRTRSTGPQAHGSSSRSKVSARAAGFEGDEAESDLREQGAGAEASSYGRGKSPWKVVEALSTQYQSLSPTSRAARLASLPRPETLPPPRPRPTIRLLFYVLGAVEPGLPGQVPRDEGATSVRDSAQGASIYSTAKVERNPRGILPTGPDPGGRGFSSRGALRSERSYRSGKVPGGPRRSDLTQGVRNFRRAERFDRNDLTDRVKSRGDLGDRTRPRGS
nr:hypothetical protein Itr_chr14CG09620 [Ipomoea trifida]